MQRTNVASRIPGLNNCGIERFEKRIIASSFYNLSRTYIYHVYGHRYLHNLISAGPLILWSEHSYQKTIFSYFSFCHTFLTHSPGFPSVFLLNCVFWVFFHLKICLSFHWASTYWTLTICYPNQDSISQTAVSHWLRRKELLFIIPKRRSSILRIFMISQYSTRVKLCDLG